MDPNKALTRIIAAFTAFEWAECYKACEDLLGWLNKGGFAPGNFKVEDVRGFCVITSHTALAQIESLEEAQADASYRDSNHMESGDWDGLRTDAAW